MAFVSTGCGNRAHLLTRKHCTRSAVCVRPSRLEMSAAAGKVPVGLKFAKYQGLGNDFILIDNRTTETPLLTPEQSEKLCDRHFGVGGDGVIFLLPPTSDQVDCTMRIYNSDGSEPEMCGNGIRCLAKFAAELDENAKDTYKVATLAGVITPRLTPDGSVCVDMGEPELELAKVPAVLPDQAPGASSSHVRSLVVDGRMYEVLAVSMGNPHCITFVSKEEFEALDASLEAIGPKWENHPAFPKRVNTEFIYKERDDKLHMLVWERGAGRTLACGTGACAVVVAAVLAGVAQRKCEVVLPGGPLLIEWREDNNRVYMTGPGDLVFKGVL
ncbi:Diaminopimelate epimerase 1 [Porphyridium purpureum]|uniref:diaminopimelate epimerase n=1 Tax=Porphyridium purpureum TaxID=35688 RepID=A0A5J4Z3Z3_PORPP|nr:Diaminopimelate epimerase 1 [Porphyridium purpureum]|eukprot:POR6943..scf295_1